MQKADFTPSILDLRLHWSEVTFACKILLFGKTQFLNSLWSVSTCSIIWLEEGRGGGK